MPTSVERPLHSGARRANLDALNIAIQDRGLASGLIHHPDRDSQYTSVNFVGGLKEAEFVSFMGRMSDAFDNSLAGSFVSTLQRGLLHRRSWLNRESEQGGISEYMEYFYNPYRRHSALGHERRSNYEKLGSKEWPWLDGQPSMKPGQRPMPNCREF